MSTNAAIQLTDEVPFEVMKRSWQPVANSADLLMGKLLSYQLFDVDLVVGRFPSGLLAAENSCPHKGARLSQSHICEGELQCAYHGWRFNMAGECTNIPSLIDSPKDKLRLSHLRNFPVQERYGMIWVQMEPDASVRLPDVPEFENREWTFMVGPPTPFKSGFRREVENYVDMTHFAFAHATTLGKAASSTVPEMTITVLDDGFLMEAPFPALESSHEQRGKLQSAHQRRQRCYLPNFTTIRQSFPDGDERVLVHIPSPNSLNECTCFWALAVSPNFDGPPPQEQLDFAIKVLDEDRTMCESQRPREVPINPSRGGWGVLVTPGDTLANTYQKCFRKYLMQGMARRSDVAA